MRRTLILLLLDVVTRSQEAPSNETHLGGTKDPSCVHVWEKDRRRGCVCPSAGHRESEVGSFFLSFPRCTFAHTHLLCDAYVFTRLAKKIGASTKRYSLPVYVAWSSTPSLLISNDGTVL